MNTANERRAAEIREIAYRMLAWADQVSSGDVEGDTDHVQTLNAYHFQKFMVENDPHELLAHLAERSFAARRRRSDFFPGVPFGEPIWDILLYLFVIAAEGVPTWVANLLSQIGVKSAPGVRWLEILIHTGAVSATGSPSNIRGCFVSLSNSGISWMSAYLSACTLLPISKPISEILDLAKP